LIKLNGNIQLKGNPERKVENYCLMYSLTRPARAGEGALGKYVKKPFKVLKLEKDYFVTLGGRQLEIW